MQLRTINIILALAIVFGVGFDKIFEGTITYTSHIAYMLTHGGLTWVQ